MDGQEFDEEGNPMPMLWDEEDEMLCNGEYKLIKHLQKENADLHRQLDNFKGKIHESMQDLPPEIVKLLKDKFWDLI